MYNGSIMGELFVLANEHTQFFVVNAYVIFYHVFWCLTVIFDIIFDEIKYHIGIVHGGSTIGFLCKTVVVIPWFHKLY